MLNKKLFIVLLSVCIFSFNGCSRIKKAEQQFPVTYRLADIHKEGYPTVTGSEFFAQLVNDRTDGRIKIEVLSSGVVGDENSSIELVQFGKLDFARVSISPLATYSPELKVLMLPFEYRDADHFWNVLDGKIGVHFLESLKDYDFYGLCYYDSGARCFYTTKPVRRIDDIKGLKIRVQESALMMEFVSSLGAVPSPMPLENVLPELKKGTIDGAENNIPSYETTGQYKVAKYYLLDEHSRIPDILIASKKVLDKLSESDKQIIFQSAKDSVQVQRAAWNEYEHAAYNKVCKAGCVFITLNPQENEEEVNEAMENINKRLSPSERRLVKQIRNIK